ncbi:uncharacterized protein LOC144056949 isoform X2 [Vanacampus margaritifer]
MPTTRCEDFKIQQKNNPNYMPPSALPSLDDNANRVMSLEELQEKAERFFGGNFRSQMNRATLFNKKHCSRPSVAFGLTTEVGRIAGSTFKAATRSEVTQPSLSPIKKTCYPRSQKFSTQTSRWGCKHGICQASI